MEIQYMTGATLENNACGGTGFLFADLHALFYAGVDYNAYENCSTYNCWDASGADTSKFSLYQSTTGFDTHGLANLASSTYFKVNGSGVPQAGSPLLGAGANLPSLCTGDLTPLCKDINGVQRPASGSWDIGAYQSSTSTIPAAPTNLNLVVR
jgi:hypothetical protein